MKNLRVSCLKQKVKRDTVVTLTGITSGASGELLAVVNNATTGVRALVITHTYCVVSINFWSLTREASTEPQARAARTFVAFLVVAQYGRSIRWFNRVYSHNLTIIDGQTAYGQAVCEKLASKAFILPP